MDRIDLHVSEETLRDHDRRMRASWIVIAFGGAVVLAIDLAVQPRIVTSDSILVLAAVVLAQFAGGVAAAVGTWMALGATLRLATSRAPLDVVLDGDTITIERDGATLHAADRVIEATAYETWIRIGVAGPSGPVRFAIPLERGPRDRVVAHLRRYVRVDAPRSFAIDTLKTIAGGTATSLTVHVVTQLVVLAVALVALGLPIVACTQRGPIAGLLVLAGFAAIGVVLRLRRRT